MAFDRNRLGLDLAALFAGAALTLAYAPWSWFPLAYLTPALVFLIWFQGSARRAFWRGWLFGIGQFGAGVHWVYYSLHDFGQAAPLFAGLATFLLVAYLALYPAVQGWLLRRMCSSVDIPAALLWFPAVWVLAEQMREYLLTGFPWLRLGYSQIDSPLGALAPVFGVSGVSLATAAVAGALGLLLTGSRRARLYGLGMASVVFLASFLIGRLVWVHPVENPITVALVQGNVPQSVKWNPQWQSESLRRYRDMTLAAPAAQLVIWPETALPGLLQDLGDFVDPMAAKLAERGGTVLTGVPSYDPTGARVHNSVAQLGADGGIYHKRHLVPFGEFLPLRSWLEFFHSYVEIPMADFGAGDPQQSPLMVANHPIGISICYEIIFGELIRTSLPAARLLVNVSNDAWFGDSAAPHQHLQMVRMRALETGRQILRATNDGITAIIDERGVVQSRIERARQAVLSGEVQPLAGATPYVRHGYWGTIGIVVLMLVLACCRKSAQLGSSSTTRP